MLTDRLGKTSWHSIDISGNDRHILLFWKKFHDCNLLPFAKEGQTYLRSHGDMVGTSSHLIFAFSCSSSFFICSRSVLKLDLMRNLMWPDSRFQAMKWSLVSERLIIK